MKNRIFAVMFALFLCVSITIPAFATEADSDNVSERLIDSAGLMTEDEQAQLLDKLNEISVRQKMDVTLVTLNDAKEYTSVRDLADDTFIYNKYGYGENRDGVLLLICMEERDWYIATHGYGITVFTDAGIQYIGDEIKPDLSDGNYYDAFSKYADLCDKFITKANEDEPFDNNNLPREPLSVIWIPISVVIGFIIALIVVGIMKSKLKSVRFQPAANSYLKKDSLKVTEKSDLFLYTTVTRTEKPKDNDSSSGGSSTHTSSSGDTFGGGGGKF